MSIELGGFLGLAALMIGLFAWLRQDVSNLCKEVNDLRKEVNDDIKQLRQEISELRQRMAHLEGLLEGLREAITRRVA